MTATQHTDRLDTIQRAIDFIDSTDPADLKRYLLRTSLHDHIKADPAMLRQHLAASVLAAADGTGITFPAWKAAQQILQAAGLPY
ncbi:MAG TPA: hypothetical protein VHZ03_15845 [Trebonia sp.]|jgi:hypothetical protein|nr:hypothetical protein [Trebonia sp.]